MTMSECSTTTTNLTHEERTDIVRTHFQNKGYRVHSGLQFGVELVLYSDIPSKVHSDFCVHVPQDNNGKLDWRMIQTLVRSMPSLKKTLIVAHVKEKKVDGSCDDSSGGDTQQQLVKERYVVHELAISSEHAPFRHKNIPKGVGTQIKPQPKHNE